MAESLNQLSPNRRLNALRWVNKTGLLAQTPVDRARDIFPRRKSPARRLRPERRCRGAA
jgi:hypothetical protein